MQNVEFWSAVRTLPPDTCLHWNFERLTRSSGEVGGAVYAQELSEKGLKGWAWLILASTQDHVQAVWTPSQPQPSQVLMVEPDNDIWVVREEEDALSDWVAAQVVSLVSWSAELVSSTLESWTRTVLNRDDVYFEVSTDPGPPSAFAVSELTEPDLYYISDKVRVSERVLDSLLGLPPEQASTLTREIAILTSEQSYGERHWSD